MSEYLYDALILGIPVVGMTWAIVSTWLESQRGKAAPRAPRQGKT